MAREPLYPHVPQRREPLYPHVPKARAEPLPAPPGPVEEPTPTAPVATVNLNLNRKDIIAELRKQGKPLLIDDLDVLEQKIGDAKAGYKPDINRPVLVHRAIEAGVLTDGYLLVEDRAATEAIIGKFLENEKKKEVRKLIRLRSFATEAEAKEHIDKLFEQYGKEGTFPHYKNLYPKPLGKEAKLIGVFPAPVGGEEYIIAYLSDGEHIMPVDSDKLAFMHKYLPDAKMMFHSASPTTSPLTFVVRGEDKGILMPLFFKDVPEAISDKARR